MIKKTLLEADKLFKSVDMNMVAVYSSSEKTCCVSGKTDDDLLYLFCENKDKRTYDYQQFAIRNWQGMHSILNTFSEKGEDNLSVMIQNDENHYPSLLYIQSGRMKMKYYVQNYNIISKQDTLKDAFAKKKFKLGANIVNNASHIDKEIIKELSKLASVMDNRFFRIGGDGVNNYFYLGDENKSVDFCRIDIGSNGGVNNWSMDSWFSVDYFVSLYKSLESSEMEMMITPNQIMMKADNNDVIKVGAIRAKKL